MKKVLIANRGEIACRTIRSLKRLGISSVSIYATEDVSSLHVLQADEAFPLGPGGAAETYLNTEKVLEVARACGADGVFPGYGFLSENAEFAEACGQQGLIFIGPTTGHLREFGLKHRARALAVQAEVPLLPGSELLANLEEGKTEAKRIGYPVMLKSTAGGGGIGLLLCANEAELEDKFESTVRLSENNFSQGGVFLEKFVANARHIEVQIFGDGRGDVVTLGERDCSAQRRNQKVIEETPAPGISSELRSRLAAAAMRLAKGVNYLSAGTVEFILDRDSEEFYFLEVNTRLQVEHGITEQVSGVDLVSWMLLTARGTPPKMSSYVHTDGAHSVEARIYAENPARGFQPSAGLLTEAHFPREDESIRVDTWVERGVEVSARYDPMLAKLIVTAKDRSSALNGLAKALSQTRLSGIETNLSYLQDIVTSDAFVSGAMTTGTLSHEQARASGIEVLRAGTISSVQDAHGRVGYWNVGIPPSGAMDSLALRLGNRAVGNDENAAGLEMAMNGAHLRFAESATVALTGACMQATLDGIPVERYVPIEIAAGQELHLGLAEGPGARSYLAVRGGLDVPPYLGSRATFDLGRFGGHAGRHLRLGDMLRVGDSAACPSSPRPVPSKLRHQYSDRWEIGVMYGPHGAPDFFTPEDIAVFFESDYEVHYNSARTGVRLIGPKPNWARADGGEAGLHPSNIHDNAYAFGAVDFTGDMPIILGPDGPSLGGFVCPATVITSELWKLGQLRPGDRVRFIAVSAEVARRQQAALDAAVAQLEAPTAEIQPTKTLIDPTLSERPETTERPQIRYRACGDQFLLVEYGPLKLELNLRFRVHALMQALAQSRLAGVIEVTPGIRSLQVHFDSQRLTASALVSHLEKLEDELPSIGELKVPTRVVHLPLSWDDPSTQLAIEKYSQLVRKDAPWAPSNIEFIRRINGLNSIEDVKRIVFDASYLVLGLGDVYLGAPVATPVDPRHRLVTTKYNPARTWTPENAVGIGGAYMCIYGMEGPGGYQFVGRTLQMFNRFRSTKEFEPDKPWLLRFFDQIRFYPVSAEELTELRDAFIAGRHRLKFEEELFDLSSYNSFLSKEATSIRAFKQNQQSAFEAERQRWIESGQLSSGFETEAASQPPAEVPAGMSPIESPVAGSVWKLTKTVGAEVKAGDRVLVLESMKMEMEVLAPKSGRLHSIEVAPGQAVSAGQVLALVGDAEVQS